MRQSRHLQQKQKEHEASGNSKGRSCPTNKNTQSVTRKNSAKMTVPSESDVQTKGKHISLKSFSLISNSRKANKTLRDSDTQADLEEVDKDGETRDVSVLVNNLKQSKTGSGDQCSSKGSQNICNGVLSAPVYSMPESEDARMEQNMEQSSEDPHEGQVQKEPQEGDSTQTQNMSGPLSPDCPLNITDTFIRIETKEGKSSEKIPFAQFLQHVIVDKNSGSFTVSMKNFNSLSDLSSQVEGSLASVLSEKAQQQDSSKSNTKESAESSLIKRSTNQLQSRNSRAVSAEQGTSGKHDNARLNSKVESTEIHDRVSITSKPSCKKVKTNVVQAPRRSSRTPAKNMRFAKDYVDSTTLGKPVMLPTQQSSSSWNTQLMTLALAAETHKRSPQDATGNHQQCSNVDQKIASEASAASSTENSKEIKLSELPNLRSKTSLPLSKLVTNSVSEPFRVKCLSTEPCPVLEQKNELKDVMCDNETHLSLSLSDSSDAKVSSLKRIDGVSVNTTKTKPIGLCESSEVKLSGMKAANKSKESENSKIISAGSASIRGPKTLKRYQPVSPLVKRTLAEAFMSIKEATKQNLSAATHELLKEGEEFPPNVYYTIMEPKLEAKGHGLMVKKSGGRLGFQVTDLVGTSNNLVPSACENYPQDRLFSCDKCPLVFTSSNIWLQHSLSAHNISPDVFETPGLKRAPELHQCDFCEQKFPYKFMLDIHIKRKRHSDMKHFRCTLCKETFSTHKEREDHWMVAHPGRTCGLCGKMFTNIVMLRRHIANKCHGVRFRKQPGELKEAVTTAGEIMIVSSADLIVKSSSTEHASSGISASNTSLEEKAVDEMERDIVNDDTLTEPYQSATQKLRCQTCSAEFFTSSAWWKHMMKEHQQMYPHGFRDRLLDRLERNEQDLANSESSLTQNSVVSDKNKYFMVMNPKLTTPNARLSVAIVNKEYSFKVQDEKSSSESYSPSKSTVGNIKQLRFECNECQEKFASASNYRQHQSRIHGVCFEAVRLLGAFQCNVCSESYPCQFMLEKHQKKHIGKKLLPCSLCDLEFHKIQERRQHWQTDHPGIGCPNCGKMYASIKYLQKHISLNCQDHFPPTKKFLDFQKRQHNDFEMGAEYKGVEKKILRCHLCPKICSSVHGWRRHMSDAHEDTGFSKLSNTCIICGQLIYGYKALEKHLLDNHAEDSGLPVDEENSQVQEAVEKSETDIQDYKAAGKDTSDIVQDQFGNYQCPLCSKTHPELRAIKTHIRTHINMELECSQCGKTFKNPALLKQHIQRHRKDAVYSCNTCGKSFHTLLKLNKHCKVHHAKGNFVCEVCGASFTLNEYLHKHKKCHTDIRPHSCTICTKSFRTKAELRTHFLIHTRETPYVCQYCGRGFSQRGNYRTHLAQHTGEKPYQCPRCPLAFALQCHLKRHMATHDQLIQYRCLWCDKECTQRKHMQMHVRRVHKEDFVQHEEEMKLNTPTPIPESQARLYNRRPAKACKIRRQYKTKAERVEPPVISPSESIDHMIVGLAQDNVTKEEPMDVGDLGDESTVVPEDVTIAVAPHNDIVSHSAAMEGFEILINSNSEDQHQAFIKDGDPPAATDLLLQENMQLVVGDNNEISIIIKNDQSGLHGGIDTHPGFEPAEVHPSLQEALAALASQSVGIKQEDGEDVVEVSGISLGIADMDKDDGEPHNQILNFGAVPDSVA